MTSNGFNFASPMSDFEEVTIEKLGGRLTVRGTTLVRADTTYMQGHFPEFRILPGVFLIEAVRHVVAAAFRQSRPGIPEFFTIHSARFVAPVLPGDTVGVIATVEEAEGSSPFAVVAECVRSDGSTAAHIKADFRYGA